MSYETVLSNYLIAVQNTILQGCTNTDPLLVLELILVSI